MQHSSSESATPKTFRGFGIVIASLIAGYLALVGSLGWGIQASLTHASVASPPLASVSGEPAPVADAGAAPVIKANATD